MTTSAALVTRADVIPTTLPDDHPLAIRRSVARRSKRGGSDALAQYYLPVILSGMRAWGYGRVSKLGHSGSDDNQGELIRHVCDQIQAELVELFNCHPDPRKRDRSASSRATARRLEWERMIAALEYMNKQGWHADTHEEVPQLIVFPEVSRSSREAWKFGYFLTLCKSLGVAIYVIAACRAFQVHVAADHKQLMDMASAAEYELDVHVDRIERGLVPRMDSGKPMGHTKYGWYREFDRVTKQFVWQHAHPEVARVVRLITRLAGPMALSVTTIAKYLTERRYRTPADWSHAWTREKRPTARWTDDKSHAPWTGVMVRRIAVDVASIGKKRLEGGTLIDGHWDALVDEADYYAAVRRLEDPERKAKFGRKGKGRRTQPDRVRHLLSRFANCTCGGTLRHQPATEAVPATGTRKARSAKPASYQCLDCYARIDAAALEGYVVVKTIMFLARPDIYRRFGQANDKAVVMARADRDQATADLDALYASVSRGETSRRMAQAEEECLTAKITEAEDRIKEASTPSVVLDVTKDGVRVADLERWFARADRSPASKREALMRLVKITVAPAPRRGCPITERVTVAPACPTPKCTAALRETPDGWTCPACTTTDA